MADNTSSVIDFLKGESGNYLYPITLVSAIYNLNGDSLETLLAGKQPVGNYAASSHTHKYAGSSSAGGSATSANKLAAAVALKIGNSSKNFDGSGGLTWTLSEIGAAAASHGTHVTYGTAAPAANGTASAGSASSVSRSDHVHPLQTTVSGNAGSATKLATARNLTIGGTAKSFDGTAALSWTLAEIGAAAASHAHAISDITNLQTTLDGKAPSSHGTHVTYGTAAPAANGTASVGTASSVSRSDHVHPLQTTVSGNAGSATKLATARKLTIGSTGKDFDGTGALSWTLAEIGAAAASHGTHVTYGTAAPAANGTASAGSASSVSRSDHVHPLQTTVSGNAGSATKLATARKLTIGSTGKTFDGSAAVSWTLAEIGAAAASHTHSYLPLSGGTLTGNLSIKKATPELLLYLNDDSRYIDLFLETAGYINIQNKADSDNMVNLIISPETDALNSLIKIGHKVSGTNTYYNLYGEHNKPTPSEIGAAAASHGTHVTFTTTTPKAAGTASAGSASSVSRSDHVHPAQTTVSGNAGTATKLKTAVNLTIGSTAKSFDGSAAVSWTLAEIGAAAASHTHSYLPLSGGDLTERLNVSSSYFGVITVNRTTAGKIAGIGFKENGTLIGHLGMQSDGEIARYDANGSNGKLLLDSANYSSYALPLTGGNLTGQLTISRDSLAVLKITRTTEGYYAGISFNNPAGCQGIISMNADGNLIKYPLGVTTTAYKILDTQNYKDHVLPVSGGITTGTALWLYNKYGRLYNGTSQAQLETYKTAGAAYDRTILALYASATIDKAIRITRYTGTSSDDQTSTTYQIFGQHNGNACKIVSSAPSDTTVLWADY